MGVCEAGEGFASKSCQIQSLPQIKPIYCLERRRNADPDFCCIETFGQRTLMGLFAQMEYHDPVLTSTRPRLVILKGAVPHEASQVQVLKSAFDVVEVHSAAAAKKMLDGSVGGVVVCAPCECINVDGEPLPDAATTILARVGDGVGVVDSTGAILWTDARFKVHDEHVRAEFIQKCRQAIDLFNMPADKAGADRRHTKRFGFASDGCQYELIVSPASLDQTLDKVMSVVGVLWDVSAGQRMLEKALAVDAAGADLLRFDSTTVSRMNMAERLKMLEQKIIRSIREVLHFDNFEVRLLDRESQQLELVIAQNIAPLRVGEVIYAQADGNGISGYVAATGKCYLCPNVQEDSLYREGLDSAASSLTVPLKLDDRVIGTLNIESRQTNAFSEHDRRFAEQFGRYIATAMNILDLLVIERFTTNEQVASNIVGELSIPLAELTSQLTALRTTQAGNESVRKAADQLLGLVDKMNTRIKSCTAGPRTILGAEQELHKQEPDPLLVGKRVLVADDEPAIRDTLGAILVQKGAIVTICQTGGQTIDALDKAAKVPGEFFDLVISDIKMPDRNGYEVYRTAKSFKPDTPVILMTGFGYDPHHSIVRASQEGLQSFLFKPFKVSQLMDLVTRSLTKK